MTVLTGSRREAGTHSDNNGTPSQMAQFTPRPSTESKTKPNSIPWTEKS
jgi:hypothetical protein